MSFSCLIYNHISEHWGYMIIEIAAVNFDFYQTFRDAVVLLPVIECFFHCKRFYFFLFLEYYLPSRIKPFRYPSPELLPTFSRMS